MPRGPKTIKKMLERLDFGECWEAYLGTPDRVKDWYFAAYRYIDEINYMFPAREVFKKWSLHEEILKEVSSELKEIGWDGEGVFQIFWLPPFLGFGEGTLGCFGLQVKQDNDGISWIACPQELPMMSAPRGKNIIYKEFRNRSISEGRIKYMDLSEEEHSDHLNLEKHMYGWCLKTYLGLSSREAEKKSEALYIKKTEEQQRVLFALGSWHLAMLEIKGSQYLREFPNFVNETTEYMEESNSFFLKNICFKN